MDKPDREATIRDAFAQQAQHCRRLGSPFMGLLCDTFAEHLGRESAIERRVLDWPGIPDASGDALPLRLAGGLNALVRAGRLPELAKLYPPHPLPSPDTLWETLRSTFGEAEAELLPWLDLAPQTNEVARSAVLMAGLLVLADRVRQPLALYELGASAGLNLILDRYAYRLGTREIGLADGPLRLAPAWSGGDPPAAELRIVARQGVDLNPLDVRSATDRARLLAYVWPDQPERIARLEAALASAADDPPRLERGDAAAWIEREITREVLPGTTRVVMHSIAFQYFPEETAARITAHMEEVGRAATAEVPLAWLRFEHEGERGRATLRLRLWPDGSDHLLALPDPHARSIEWQG
jgi:hypothetical protein